MRTSSLCSQACSLQQTLRALHGVIATRLPFDVRANCWRLRLGSVASHQAVNVIRTASRTRWTLRTLCACIVTLDWGIGCSMRETRFRNPSLPGLLRGTVLVPVLLYDAGSNMRHQLLIVRAFQLQACAG